MNYLLLNTAALIGVPLFWVIAVYLSITGQRLRRRAERRGLDANQCGISVFGVWDGPEKASRH
jgi:hypothetical protein